MQIQINKPTGEGIKKEIWGTVGTPTGEFFNDTELHTGDILSLKDGKEGIVIKNGNKYSTRVYTPKEVLEVNNQAYAENNYIKSIIKKHNEVKIGDIYAKFFEIVK